MSLLVLMLLGFVIPPTAATARDKSWDRQAAEKLLEEARAKREEIAAMPAPVRSHFVRCASLFRQVYRRDPHFGGSDDAVFEAGVVLEESWTRFSDRRDLNAAAKQYEFLISDYAVSRHHAETLLRLGDLYAGPLGQPEKAAELHATLKTRFRRSKAGAELTARAGAPLVPPKPTQAGPVPEGISQRKVAAAPPQPQPEAARPPQPESQTEPQSAEQLLLEARALRNQIAAASEPDRVQFLHCISIYRQVYRRDPHYGGTDDAIFEAGLLLQDAWTRFSDQRDLSGAAKQFSFLISDYAASPHHAEALLRLGDLYAGPLALSEEAAELYATLKTRFRRSKAAAELLARASLPSPPSSPAPARALAAAAPQPKPAQKPTQTEPDRPKPSTGETRVDPQATPPSPSASAGRAAVTNLRHWSTDDYTRVVIDMDGEASFRKTLISNPDRLYFDISRAWLTRDLMNRTFPVGDAFLKQVRIGQNSQDVVRVVLDFEHIADHSVFDLHDPYRLVVDIHGTRPIRASSEPRRKGNPRPDELASAPTAGPARSGTTPATPSRAVTGTGKQPAAVETGLKPTDSSPAGDPSRTASKPRSETREPPRTPVAAPDRPTSEAAVAPSAPPKIVPLGPRTTPEPAGARVRAESPAPSAATVERAEARSSDSRKSPAVLPPEKVPPPPITPPRGSRTLTRMLGLKIGRIVLDPGHGGHDTGTIGKGGLLEKDLVLDLAHHLRSRLEESLGAEVIMTREDDRFIPLEERTAIANQARADLFVSIHANSSSSRSTSGVETYFLDFARSERDRAVAARENASSVRNISDLEDLIKKIIQADKSTESREFASTVQKRLFSALRPLFPRARNRGVRSAPFVVLIGANMPSILAEVAFISNPRDEKVLFNDSSKERLANALSAGIEDYVKHIGVETANNRGQ